MKAANERIRLAASQSFTAEEIACLRQLGQTLLRGGDTSAIVRSAPFAGLMRKAGVMEARVRVQLERRRDARVRRCGRCDGELRPLDEPVRGPRFERFTTSCDDCGSYFE